MGAAHAASRQAASRTGPPLDALFNPLFNPARSTARVYPLFAADVEDTDDDPLERISFADLLGLEEVDIKVRCPFHAPDNDPSCHIYDDHFHCFVCEAHGNQVDWLMQIKKMTREEAVHFLRNWNGRKATARPAIQPNSEEKTQAALRLWDQGRQSMER